MEESWAARSIPAWSTRQTSYGLERANAEPAHGAFLMLWIGYIAIQLIIGLDKFTNVLTHWVDYLTPLIGDTSPRSDPTRAQAVTVFAVRNSAAA